MTENTDNPEKLDLILRDTLAVERTRLANERTLLAFFRTGLSLIVTALAIFELKENLWYIRAAWLLVVLGATVIIVGGVRYYITKRRIANSYK